MNLLLPHSFASVRAKKLDAPWELGRESKPLDWRRGTKATSAMLSQTRYGVESADVGDLEKRSLSHYASQTLLILQGQCLGGAWTAA